jgi:glycosyltransferase involved in cell wall biosynthesis
VEKGLKGLATRFFRHDLAKKADFLFACSDLAARDVFGDKAVDQGRVKIIHNAIDVKRFTYDQELRNKMREQLGLTDALVLGHVGRFNYQKNHPYLIDIFAAVCEKRDDAVLLLLGEGPDMDVIKEKCRRLNLDDKVIFAGNQKETEKYYQTMDVFLLPSFFEGLPGVLMEAQAAGLRCFVSDTVTREARATDLVTYLSIDQSPASWADEILKTASYERRDTYEALAAAGFDVRQQAEGYRIFYQNGDGSKL